MIRKAAADFFVFDLTSFFLEKTDMVYQKKHREYQGGYVPVHEAVLLEVIASLRERRAGFKAMVRVFAAICEQKGLPQNSKVDLYRIVNCQAGRKGVKRLSHRVVDDLVGRVKQLAVDARCRPQRRKRAVSRRVLRAIAQGRLSSSEVVVALFYASRRICPGHDLQRLKQDERYARFKYAELEQLSGIGRSRIVEAVAKLKQRGVIHVVEVHQSNVNAYGLCFVDGWFVSVCRSMAECARKVVNKVVAAVSKTATPMIQNRNAPDAKTATLTNKNPKTLKENNKVLVSNNRREPVAQILDRLRQRFCVVSDNSIAQTA